MPFTDWLFIDKADLRPEGESLLPGARFKGTMERLDNWKWVRYLSICHTPVGRTILDRYPSLRWVMVRGTAHEKVDMHECRRRGIGVAEAIPTQDNCAKYLLKHAGDGPFLFYGYGNIGQRAWAKLDVDAPCPACDYVNRVTSRAEMLHLVETSGTIFMSVSGKYKGRKPPVFNARFFRACNGVTLVSVCRPSTTDNRALLKAIQEERVRKAVFDTPGTLVYDELIRAGLVDTGHTAWLDGMSRADFLKAIKDCAESLMTDEPLALSRMFNYHIALPRKE